MEQLRALDDTICAISTPHGIGGIAVVRVSGSKAIPIVSKAWRGINLATAKSHTAHLGTIVDNEQRPLDQVVATIFRAPHTFTGEDVIEISCHGSVWIQQQIVATLIACGCRAALGGEFTRRAFMNGKIDLSQAEAIADVIASSSKAAHKIAISQMRGDFSKMIQSLRDTLLEFCALLELELDFSEEEVEFADRAKLTNDATNILNTLTRLASSFKTGDAIKNGFPVAIVGETNTGKSTLLNRLLHDDRALVSDIRGTTRDTIDGTITIDGILFRFIDTAGIRQTSDAIESLYWCYGKTGKKVKISPTRYTKIIESLNVHTIEELDAKKKQLKPVLETVFKKPINDMNIEERWETQKKLVWLNPNIFPESIRKYEKEIKSQILENDFSDFSEKNVKSMLKGTEFETVTEKRKAKDADIFKGLNKYIDNLNLTELF